MVKASPTKHRSSSQSYFAKNVGMSIEAWNIVDKVAQKENKTYTEALITLIHLGSQGVKKIAG